MADLVEIRSFVYKAFALDVQGDKPASVRIGAIEAENVRTVDYGRLSLKNVSFAADGVTGGLDMFEIRDLKLGGFYKMFGGMVRARFVPNLSAIEQNLPGFGKWRSRA